MTSWLIGSGLSNHQSSPIRAKVKCCKSHDLFGCQVKDCSATRIPSLSITGHHPGLTSSLIEGVLTPLQWCSRRILHPHLTGRIADKIFCLAVRVFANGPGDLGSIPGRVIPKTQKMVLDASLLNTQHYKVRIKGKVEQSRERSCALPYTLV